MPPRPRPIPIPKRDPTGPAAAAGTSNTESMTTSTSTSQTLSPKPTSTASNAGAGAAKSMPPPPVPPSILEPEITAMAVCLKNAVVKTGEIYKFYADTQRLGIQRYAPRPPQALTSALGREIETYDQLCDSMETSLRNAIASKARQAADEEAAKAKMASPEPIITDTEMMPPPPLPGRERETLDLSSASLRISADEVFNYWTDRVLPVDEAQSHFDAEMDLLMAYDTIDLSSLSDAAGPVSTGAGTSANQPIELDLDALDMDLFGDAPDSSAAGNTGDGLFSPAPSMDLNIKAEENDEVFMAALQGASTTGNGTEDLFGNVDPVGGEGASSGLDSFNLENLDVDMGDLGSVDPLLGLDDVGDVANFMNIAGSGDPAGQDTQG
ncbi:hypothetical protein DL96DRAFT_1571892 [Flagelloscypha sp. PMI_526]|nr:hypothetical protein DL96DRAFT_1571892 [Flagelloscypha sp. PMI_526]